MVILKCLFEDIESRPRPSRHVRKERAKAFPPLQHPRDSPRTRSTAYFIVPRINDRYSHPAAAAIVRLYVS